MGAPPPLRGCCVHGNTETILWIGRGIVLLVMLLIWVFLLDDEHILDLSSPGLISVAPETAGQSASQLENEPIASDAGSTPIREVDNATTGGSVSLVPRAIVNDTLSHMDAQDKGGAVRANVRDQKNDTNTITTKDNGSTDAVNSSTTGGNNYSTADTATGPTSGFINTTSKSLSGRGNSPNDESMNTITKTGVVNSKPMDQNKTGMNSGDWHEVKCLEPTNHTRIILPNNETWCLDQSRVWRYNITHGSAKRRTRLGCERCLANKNVLLMGDSRTRYQYLSLALMLSRGVFVRCADTVGSSENEYCPYMYANGDWQSFYVNSNKMLRTNTTSELCYCFRDNKNPGRNYELVRENRFFTAQTEFGPIRITYIQSFQDWCNLDLSFPPYNRGNLSCETPGTCNSHVNKSSGIIEFHPGTATQCLKNISLSFDPPVTHAFITTGWMQKDIGCELVRFANTTGIKTWLNGAPRKHGPNSQIPDISPKQGCGVPFYDRDTMTVGLKTLYKDSVHVRSHVNEEFNHRLMDTLCPLQ